MEQMVQLRTLMEAQSGVITRVQALGFGMSDGQVDHRLGSSEWVRVHPGVYRLAGMPPNAEQALRAAALWAEDGVLTGIGAAWWWRALASPPLRWEFLISGTAPRSRQATVSLQRRWVDPTDVTVHRGLRVLSPPLAVLRAAVAVERRRRGQGVRLVDRAKQTELVTGEDLERAFRRNRGTWGTTAIRELLAKTGDNAHSELERLGISILESAGITGFTVNVSFTLSDGRVVELDAAFEEQRVGLEFDGFAYHSSPEAMQHDHDRQNALVREGWTILRFGDDALRNRPASVVRDVLEVLARSGGPA